MERHRERGERFNDHHPLNSTPWFRDAHRPNFPADHHHHHNHHYNQHHNYHQFEHHPSHQQFEPQPSHQHHFERFPEHQHPSSEQNDAFWSNGGNGSDPSRKRGFHHSGRGASPEHTEGSNLAKLYVATVPRTATEETIRSLFQGHGNVVEIIQPRDKKTGERHGYCFVKYATFEEADRAITALHNQYTFPGELSTVKVRYADAERDRLGLLPDKLYVGCLNKQASKREIEEIFSPYGHVVDIYIVRDEHRENRGCGFIQFSRREMALAAIKGLNEIFTMKGCDQPLIVRFAIPKRPRIGEPRVNYPFNGITSGSHPQELAMRSVPNLGDPMAGRIPPNASYPVQHILTNSQPQGVSHWANPEIVASHVTYQSYLPGQQAQSQPTSLPLQQTQTPQESSQSSHQPVSGQKLVPLIPASSQILCQQNSNVPKLKSPRTGGSQTVAATSVAPTIPQSLETVAPLECDWSEHTCPDGHKYYYNCVTCESRWNKPEEFILFEKLLQKQENLQNPGQQLYSHSTAPTERVSQNQELQVQTCLTHQKLKVQHLSTVVRIWTGPFANQDRNKSGC
ncbi:flowering time control protein FCA-like isoform X2 [Durio zibethinus]|uniref:Flowering time control protein FCA-like isoform X2 n=1 Tax=Durio zibethinus TaxID=66656 RepID=A0A6P5ZYL0_DURZI|nr:flowering time control protein FCA-like isoform X2 [Durio zibethinus]XP_022757836.1 flowering time control protein FCA-like isoform X2 [Durio zibethinus]XP_022757837.1 flowering time control protein FCA-like isoform X2 [Durio zibethinus]XP_022757838.1 flowering time control protein FCA-like isoform X2 [Durio zibethinus]XP_022757840.1 flowering time control protein FCA-like isoform X2 [Durio zibethinus]